MLFFVKKDLTPVENFNAIKDVLGDSRYKNRLAQFKCCHGNLEVNPCNERAKVT